MTRYGTNISSFFFVRPWAIKPVVDILFHTNKFLKFAYSLLQSVHFSLIKQV